VIFAMVKSYASNFPGNLYKQKLARLVGCTK